MGQPFDYTLDFQTTNFREHPEKYRIGKGEQGVLLVQPYKAEILPHWRFKTPDIAEQSAQAIHSLYLEYKQKEDFVGMDMARKFLQMGITRSRRYANHRGGKKYNGAVPMDKKGQSGAHGRTVKPLEPDPIKAESAIRFEKYYRLVMEDKVYQQLKSEHVERYR